ncbi:helicase/secretion neighborhood CpaE-like protein [Variovorax sp. PBS-H4]|uniref:AAA family ATPase n=1 Tax=Variovorax sp. PBS-H4 TaxID=434008 RepID=UPI00131990C6|nr:AAA family ATPase [Variovorax sp. PBS-H4]VTU26439.1 helicase/secretion neighborhood CpaE-like protein [Variovorax sp. PBS-H4]
MKIAIISPNRTHLEEMDRWLRPRAHTVLLFDGGKSRMRTVVEQDQPDLLLVDGMCCDPGELTMVEHVTTHHPRTAVVLLCASHTPEFLLNSMRAGVREVLPSPVTAGALEAAVDRVAAKLAGAQGQSAGKVLAFMPCKGGSGATFLATNLAFQLSEHSSVLLIDLNLQFGDALGFVSDEKPNSTLADVARDIGRLDASFLAASAVAITPEFRLLAAPEDPSNAMEVKPEHIDAILNLAVTQHDFVLLDMPRTLDTLSIRALDRAHRIYPVLQSSLPDLRNAAKLLGVFKSLGYAQDKIELVINRFDKNSEIGLKEVRRSLGAIAQRTVADSPKEVTAAINRGAPLARLSRTSPVVKTLAEMASALAPRDEESPSFFHRLFGRA